MSDDNKRKGVLLGQATEIVVSIILSPDKIKISKVNFLNKVHKIMEFTPQRIKFEQAFEAAVAMGKIVDEEETLIKVNKINAIENKVEKAFNYNNGLLPMGCHRWNKENINFWKQFIK